MKVFPSVKKISRLALVAAGTSAMLATMSAQAQVSDGVVRIGVMMDMSGPYSGAGGAGSVLAVKLAVEDMGGTILGKPIEVIEADDQNKPNVGINLARQWIENEKVDTIITGSASSIALGIQSMMKEKKKPVLFAGPVASDLTGKSCSPMGIQYVLDTYALANGSVSNLLKQGVKTFYFIVVDYTFGASWQADATKFIEAAGAKVVGSVKHPLGATDYSSYLLQAQASKADAIVFLNAGSDTTNALKQASEFRLTQKGQKIAVFGLNLNVVTATGLEVAQGLQFTAPFYWDRDEDSRNWAKRFMARNKGVAPDYNQTSSYSAAYHYLKAVRDAGTDEGMAVMAKMKATPINDFEMKNVKIREDGQVMRPTYGVMIKAPATSKYANDFYALSGEIPGDKIHRPMSEGGCDFVKAK